MARNEIYSASSLDSNNESSRNILGFEERLGRFFGYSKKQLRTIVIFGLSNVLLWTNNALQAPFYPNEAEDKGASSSEYGLVLGVSHLVMFIMSPVFGYTVGFLNPRLVFNIGVIGTAICSILFGFLHLIYDHVTFIALSLLLRILQGCGNAASATASFAIIAFEFPMSVASTFATIETCSGVGLIVGPSLGGILFESGGFVLPFLTMGSCYLLVGILSCFMLPAFAKEEEMEKKKCAIEEKESGEDKEKSGVIAMLSIPAVLLGLFSLFVSASSVGFMMSTLEPHLRDHFDLSPAAKGFIFLIGGGLYAVTVPFWGKLCDQSDQVHIYTIIGSVMTFIAFVFIGPAPFLPIPTTLWLICLGLVIHGVGVGASYVSSFVLAMRGSVENGFPDSLATYGVVSGLYLSNLSLGTFAGASIGGVLMDFYNFKLSCYYVFATQIIVIIAAWIYICLRSTGDANFFKRTKSVF